MALISGIQKGWATTCDRSFVEPVKEVRTKVDGSEGNGGASIGCTAGAIGLTG